MIHFHFQLLGLANESIPSASSSVVMRQLRTVIRSMVTAGGNVVALDDSTIVWKPKNGKERRVKIAARASVLLGLMGPNGLVDRVVAGDEYGGVNIVLVSTMEIVDRYVVSESKVRSLCSSSISGESILVGCENGSVFMVGRNVPNRVMNLFDLDGPASALRIVGQNLHIQQGWERKIVAWNGQKSSVLA